MNFPVAVLAFKAVYYLETTRQENDRRVMTLYVKMKDMMMVMVQCVFARQTTIFLTDVTYTSAKMMLWD